MKYKLTYDQYKKAISTEQLIKAERLCRRGVLWKDSVIGFDFNVYKNCSLLNKQLENGTYKLQKYKVFKLNDPKPRIITATRFPDRVVQRSLCENGLYEAFVHSFIYDNCACQKNKGTTFAIKRIYRHLREFFKENNREVCGYYLKLDIKKYFESTPHNLLKQIVKNKIKEPHFVERVFQIIDSFKDKRAEEEIKNDEFGERGVGLGSQISQLLQLLYLSDLDHYIKEQLKVSHYIRYMDDMLLFVKTKEEVEYFLNKIKIFVKNKGLKLNHKSKIGKISDGITYMKIRYTLHENGKIKKHCCRKTFSREIRRLNKFKRLYIEGKITDKELIQHGNSWYGFAKWRCSGKQIKMIKEKVNELFSGIFK